MRKFFLTFFLFFVYSASASSSNYSWTVGSTGSGAFNSAVTRATLSEACQAAYIPFENRTYHGTWVSSTDPAIGRCYAMQSTGFTTYHVASRSGTTCPSGQTYDSSTGYFAIGGCTAPPSPGGEPCGKVVWMGGEVDKITTTGGACVHPLEADLASMCKYLSKSTRTGSTQVSFDTNGTPIDPGQIQSGGCVATAISVEHCKAPAVKSSGGVSLGPAPAECRVGLDFSGAVAGTDPVPFVPPASVGKDSGVCYPGQECELEEPPIVDESTPCKYEWDASIGMQVCRSTKFTGTPGEYTGCGTGPEGFKCYGTKPTSNGIDISVKVEEKSNLDGTTTTTKTDTITQTKCIGIGSCVTNVSNNKSTTVKLGDGTVVSESGQCVGTACAEGGKGGKGDADGDGIADCALDKCAGEDEGPELTEMTKPAEPGSFEDANTEWDEKIETAREDIAQKAELLGRLFQPIASINLASGDQELGCGESFEVPGGMTGSICFGKYESQLGILAAAVLFICALIALFIIFKPD